jgi:hypothetical protein
MGPSFRRRIPLGRGLWANLSLRGLSLSARRGPLTVNSRGSWWVRLGRGWSWRGGR